MKYRKEIDGLRAVAVLPVMLFHAGVDSFSGGFVGVDVFFVISGYLITTLICDELEQNRFSIAGFYERRARRILPALFLVVLATVPWAWALLPSDELRDYYQSVLAVSLFFSNIQFWLESGYFSTAAELKPLIHTWSLAVEEQYYILFPVLVVIIWRRARRLLMPVLLIVGLLSLALAEWGSVRFPSATFYLLPTRFWELLIGAVTALFLRGGNRLAGDGVSIAVEQALSAIGLAMILYAAVFYNRHTPFPGLYALLPTLGTALVIAFASRDTFTNRLLANRALVGVGLISYSAYLWHQPLLAFARMHLINEPAMMLVPSIVLAYLSWRFVEKPFREKHRFGRGMVFRFAVLGSLASMLLGIGGNYGVSFLYARASVHDRTLSKINKLDSDRQLLIRGGECQFNDRDNMGVDNFLANWDCWNDVQSGRLKRIPVVVTGDSHSADIVVSLKLNGYLPLQIGGSGCSLDPEYMTPDCRKIYSKLFDRVRSDPYFRYLILSNRYFREELSVTSLKRTLNYWSGLGLRMIFVTGMPEFQSFKIAALRGLDVEPDYSPADYSTRPEVIELLGDRNVLIINRKKIFCSMTKNCSYRDEYGRLLIKDYAHLTPLGAERFGKALLERSAAMAFVEKASPE